MFDFISAIPAAGSVINALAIIGGSLIGLIIKKRLPERITMVAFQVIGLSVLTLGIQMTLQSKNVLIMILSLLLGAILGGFKLEDRLQNGLKGLRTRMIERGGNSEEIIWWKVFNGLPALLHGIDGNLGSL